MPIDKYYQLLRVRVVSSTTADLPVNVTIDLPTNTPAGNRILELLWVQWQTALNSDNLPSEGTTPHLFSLYTGEIKAAADTYPSLADRGVMVSDSKGFSVTTSGAGSAEYTRRINLEDETGHGLLIATDRLHVLVNDGSTTAYNNDIGIAYRWVKVKPQEYFGLLQQQTVYS